ncbi:hypothetical protein HVA01_06160 [Halovibrio variabilis]|uniref:Putative membrane protein insertion efficiency factor n=2 Tax=Halovibrio variabilis TaxID=31910 RepID=A0A511UK66_9GAMM|nr:hypothetical protein HVA01_06160 [Halovibrio variabilis]
MNRSLARVRSALYSGPRWVAMTVLIGCVYVYQYTLSPLLGPRCRFWPSCSSYTIEAIQVHGPIKGGWMAIKRIVKCHPGNPGGMDPVPGGRSEQLCREDEEVSSPSCCERHSD